LWSVAAKVQEAHVVDDPWLDRIANCIGDEKGRIEAAAIWDIIGVPIERRTQKDNERIGDVMRRLGWRSVGQQRHHKRRSCNNR
jgi:hypothetical protein